MLTLICYPKCSTCRKAEKWLKEHSVSYDYSDISKDSPSFEELKEWYERSGIPVKKLFNTSGRLYKEMNLKERIPFMSEEEALKLLATDGMLVKRPVAVSDEYVFFGFKEDNYSMFLKK